MSPLGHFVREPWTRGARGPMPNRNCTGASRASTSCRRRAAFAGRSLYFWGALAETHHPKRSPPWCRRPERSPAPGWKGQKAPVGHLHRPALFAPWRVMWRPVFPGCHTHSGGFAIHAGRCSCTLGADNGNRTHLRGLGSRRSADELYPRCCPAGVAPGHRSENGERVLTGHAWKVGEYYVRHPRRW